MTQSYMPAGAFPTTSANVQAEIDREQADALVQGSLNESERQRQQQIVDEQAAEEAQVENQKRQEESNKPNPLQEVGTALVGGAIDAVEGVGATVEKTVTGKMQDDDFKPTWLQVSDEVEPMNRTVWGNVLRSVVEFGTLMALTRGAGRAAAATGVPGVAAAGRFLSKPGTTLKGKVVRGAAVGAVGDFASTYSEGETLSNEVQKLLPWLPNPLVVDKDDSPLERRAKNVLEGMGLNVAADLLMGWRAGVKAQKGLKAQQAKEAAQAADPTSSAIVKAPSAGQLAKADPEAVAKSTIRDLQDQRAKNLDEVTGARLKDDPLGQKGPDPYINSPMYDRPDSAVFSVPKKGAFYDNLVQAYRMEMDGTADVGRRVSVFTEAALEKRLSGGSDRLKQVFKQIEKELDDSGVIGEAVDKFDIPRDKLAKLQAARYFDLVDVAKDPDAIEQITKMLVDSATEVKNPVTGSSSQILSPLNFRAAEMLATTTAGEIADLATGIKTISGVMDTSVVQDRLFKRLDLLLRLTGEAKYYYGSSLQALKGTVPKSGIGIPAEVLAKNSAEVSEFIKNLRSIGDNDPQLLEAFFDAFTFSNGKVNTLDALYQYSKDQILNPKALFDSEANKSVFIEALQGTAYNSILSAPKTLSRAFLGSNLVAYLRPLQVMGGGLITGDNKMLQLGAHQLYSSFEGIGEAWKLASQARKSMVTGVGDVPYYNKQIIPATETSNWKNIGVVIERGDDVAAKAMYRLTSTILDFNNSPFVRYPAIGLNAIDTFTKTVVGRMELKSKAFSKAWDETGGNVTSDLIKRYEDEFRKTIFNRRGEVVSMYGKMAGEEAALMRPLSGKLGELESLVNRTPIIKPFMMFMKTGVNALELVQKHTPMLARFNGEVNAILGASADNMSAVAKYGITNVDQLMEAKALTKGRIATGYITVGSAIGLYTSGRLTGNGPADKETRNAWLQAGWRPRSIKIGDTWHNYDGLEPFASFLAVTADVGDNSDLLGEAWTENSLRKLGWLVGQNVTNKSFFAGLVPLMDIMTTGPDKSQVWIGNFLNNQAPWGGLRNELANIFNPGMREVEFDILDTIKNRNPGMRGSLPFKRDILDGSRLKDYDFPTRMFNSISPLQMNPDTDTPTRRMLRESGYDVRFLFNSTTTGVRLNATQRSEMQSLMGDEQIESQLTKLFKRQEIQKELNYYRDLRDKGVPGATPTDPNNLPIKDSLVYREIDRIFTRAKKVAEVRMLEKFPELKSTAVNAAVRKQAQREGRTNDLNNLMNITK
jgi:hypothetical protein